jgi:uncharacterized protein YyaL (SSP411 family)
LLLIAPLTNLLFLNKAIKNIFLANETITDSNEIMRNYKNNKATIHGLLDDYAFTISAFIELYQATFKKVVV